jgi:hypothetical protein
MIIRQLSLFITAGEVDQRLKAVLADAEQVSDPAVQLADGRIALNGTFKAGLSIPFSTEWTVEVRPGNCAALKLAKFNAGPFGGGALGGRVLEMVAAKLGARAGVSVDGDCLVLALVPLLAAHGIELAGVLTAVTLTPTGVDLQVK